MQIRQSKTLLRLLELGTSEAQRSGSTALVADIIFLSILKEGTSHAGHILKKLLKDWELYQLRIRVERETAKTAAKIKSAPELSAAMAEINTGIIQAGRLFGNPDMTIVNTGHFLLWLLGCRDHISTRALELYGVTPEKVEEYLRQMPADEDYYEEMQALEQLSQRSLAYRPEEFVEEEDDDYALPLSRVKTKQTESDSLLDKFGFNLSKAAAAGKIDPVIGREKEIERLIQILGRRKKNNPILVGEAGVGKSAIVEGLALRIAAGNVPATLRTKTVFSLDVASLVAGTKYRGQFEERIKSLLTELQRNREVILFIDEIHTIVGAGSTQGSLDTANILKPALARGELQCIGATTLDEYRQYIESDSALERRFQRILVEPTSKEQTLQILHNIKSHYERHHCVRYTDEALYACVELTERYLTDRNFPDKAIDVLDEAGSKAHLFNVQEPALIRELEESFSQAEECKRRAIADLNYEAAAEARIRVMALRNKLTECRSEWQREMTMHPFVLGAEHIGEVITSMTGIPVERVSQGEQSRLQQMEQHLSGLVIGQEEAVRKVTKSIQRSRAGLKDPDKPIGVFLFVGPTGVGKTHLAKELSRWMFDRDDALIRVDMSEYSEKHNVSRMIGSPPGYVGYNEGGQLTEAVRRQPYAVVLFDEIEKAHPDVFNIMLQIFDEGQLTDGLGRKVDFRNTIIILTSNVGSRAVAQNNHTVGYPTLNKERIEWQNKESQYRRALETTFAPEFINRIDDIVIFQTLSSEDVQRIVELELNHLSHRAEALGYKIDITPEAKLQLAQLGYEPRYGVRSLKRRILDCVEEPMAQLIVGGELHAGDTVEIEYRDDSIAVLRKAV